MLNSVFSTLGPEELYSICRGHVVNLTREPQCLFPKHVRYSFYGPRKNEKLIEPYRNSEANLGRASWQRDDLTSQLPDFSDEIKAIYKWSTSHLLNKYLLYKNFTKGSTVAPRWLMHFNVLYAFTEIFNVLQLLLCSLHCQQLTVIAKSYFRIFASSERKQFLLCSEYSTRRIALSDRKYDFAVTVRCWHILSI